MKKDITDAQTLTLNEVIKHNKLLWTWIQANDLSYDLYSFIKDEQKNNSIPFLKKDELEDFMKLFKDSLELEDIKGYEEYYKKTTAQASQIKNLGRIN
jgi:cytochrome b involved in lipid metabolism